MENKETKQRKGWRGSEALWLDAAYELLIASGVDAVKVMPLAKKLGMSRTSFYWHFKDRKALLAALISRWERKNTGNLIAQTEIYAETITEAIFNLFDCWIDSELFDARLDFSIRTWAHQSDEVKTILEQADLERISAIGSMFIRFGADEEQADARARTIYYTQVGYISMLVDEPLPERLEKMPAYVKIYTSHPPKKSEIARFMARH